MKRTILALAIASLSFAAFAVPPGPPAAVDVNVTNPVLPVEVSNADPVPVTIVGEAHVPFSASEGRGAPGQVESIKIDIPDGKRLIIETVGASAVIPAGTNVVFSMAPYTVADNGSARTHVFPIPVVSQGLIPDSSINVLHQHYVGLHSVRISADAVGSTTDDLEIQVRRSQVSGEVITNTGYLVTVEGYLVDR